MNGTWRDTAPWLFSNMLMEQDAGGGQGGGQPPGDPAPSQGGNGGGSDKTLTQADVDRIVQGRVGETKRQTEEAIANQLGVPIAEAKKIIEAANAAADAEKTDAQKAREAADAERAEADREKAEAKQARHDAAVERALIRALPNDLEEDVLDKKVARLGKLLEVELGADAAAIKAAVDALKKDEPLLFGVVDDGKGKLPDSDLKGKPPARRGSEDAFSRGQERAKAATGVAGYPILGQS